MPTSVPDRPDCVTRKCHFALIGFESLDLILNYKQRVLHTSRNRLSLIDSERPDEQAIEEKIPSGEHQSRGRSA